MPSLSSEITLSQWATGIPLHILLPSPLLTVPEMNDEKILKLRTTSSPPTQSTSKYISKTCLCSRDPGELGEAGSSRNKNLSPGVGQELAGSRLGEAGSRLGEAGSRLGEAGSTRSVGTPGAQEHMLQGMFRVTVNNLRIF